MRYRDNGDSNEVCNLRTANAADDHARPHVSESRDVSWFKPIDAWCTYTLLVVACMIGMVVNNTSYLISLWICIFDLSDVISFTERLKLRN